VIGVLGSTLKQLSNFSFVMPATTSNMAAKLPKMSNLQIVPLYPSSKRQQTPASGLDKVVKILAAELHLGPL
jgi:hypothetical protein